MNLLIKFSGEFFDAKDDLTSEGKELLNLIKESNRGYVVIGGGNRIRGRDSWYSRTGSDNIGVISTLMNGFILKEHLKHHEKKVKLFSHFIGFGNLYNPKDAIEAFESDHWVILASGLGRVSYVSTDLSSVIKALEVKANAVVKITKSGGVFDSDPKFNKDAKIIKNISHDEVLQKNLSVMDLSAIAIAAENQLPIAVMNVCDFKQFLNNENVGSIIGKDWR